jgi:RNA polymerase sigma factor (sigma-70 family)
MPLTAIPGQETAAPSRRTHLGTLSTCTLRQASDERLVALTRGGSERAFAEVMRRYQRPLNYYCLQMVGAPRAEDAVQQAFMQAFVALRDGGPREIALRPWLYRIARNCAIDLLRKQHEHDELDPERDGMPQPPGVLEQKEELARVVAAIQALPEGQRRALTLRELEGRSYGEISAELGHTDSGVRQLIFRARTALRNLGALVLPLGSARWRLLGSPSTTAADPHAVAVASAVSSSGGASALQVAGSVVAATLTLLGAPAAPRDDLHASGPAAAVASASPGDVSMGPLASVAAVHPLSPHADRAKRRAADMSAPEDAVLVAPQALSPPIASASPAPDAPASGDPPASPAVSAEPVAVLNAAPVTGSGPTPAKSAEPAASVAPQTAPAPVTAPVTPPPKPGEPKPVVPVKPAPPKKPVAPKTVIPAKPAPAKRPAVAAPTAPAYRTGA